MKKKIIVVPKATKDFYCKVCQRMVDFRVGKPWTLETDKVIFKTWDYGHRHTVAFKYENGKEVRAYEQEV